eukprot:gene2963-4124_t
MWVSLRNVDVHIDIDHDRYTAYYTMADAETAGCRWVAVNQKCGLAKSRKTVCGWEPFNDFLLAKYNRAGYWTKWQF